MIEYKSDDRSDDSKEESSDLNGFPEPAKLYEKHEIRSLILNLKLQLNSSFELKTPSAASKSLKFHLWSLFPLQSHEIKSLKVLFYKLC